MSPSVSHNTLPLPSSPLATVVSHFGRQSLCSRSPSRPSSRTTTRQYYRRPRRTSRSQHRRHQRSTCRRPQRHRRCPRQSQPAACCARSCAARTRSIFIYQSLRSHISSWIHSVRLCLCPARRSMGWHRGHFSFLYHCTPHPRLRSPLERCRTPRNLNYRRQPSHHTLPLYYGC
jgi:hypothetical protein